MRNEYDVAAQVEADGPHDPRYLPPLIERLEGGRCHERSRLAAEGTYRVGMLRGRAMRVVGAR